MLASRLHAEAAQQWPDKGGLHVEALEARNKAEFNSSQLDPKAWSSPWLGSSGGRYCSRTGWQQQQWQ